MAVVCPGDAVEVRHALRGSVRDRTSGTYIRLGKKGEAVIHKTPPAFTIGKAITLRPGRDVCLLSTGNMLPEAVETADRLAKLGITAQLASFHTVKPLDATYLADAFCSFPLVVTIEEHSKIGGFGSAVAEWLVDQPRQHAVLCRFGTNDTFLHESGEQEHARHHFGLTAEQMTHAILQRLRTPMRVSA